MEQREKLIELIDAITHNSYPHIVLSEAADHLIANGVVVLPCRGCYECDYHDHDGGTGYCNYWRRWSSMSDYCNRGSRKGGDE